MFFDAEEVEHICDECKAERAIFSHVIKSVPRVLVIHMKRFKANVEKMTYDKLSLPFQINNEIDLSEFCSIDATPPLPSPQKKNLHNISTVSNGRLGNGWFDSAFETPPLPLLKTQALR